MFDYIYNVVNDMYYVYYGYITIKCANNNCKRTFKISRNNYKGGLYSCNMGCSLEVYNY
jgi:hypothetical protein